MKKFSVKLQTAALLIGLAGFATPASAISDDAKYIVSNANAAAGSIVGAIQQIYAFLQTKISHDWTETQPNLDDITQVQNPLGVQLTTTQNSAVNGQSGKIIVSALGPTTDTTAYDPGLPSELSSNFAADVLPPTKAIDGMPPAAAQLCGNNMFNFESLMGYSSYANQTLSCYPSGPQNVTKNAQKYIQYVANLGSPIVTFSLSSQIPDSLSKEQAADFQDPTKNPVWADFALSRRTLVAAQSAGISNLNYLYNQRVPDGNGDSPESVANYVANWRANNLPSGPGKEGFYKTMSKSDLPIVLKEILFVLVETQRDLHELRKENQRLLAIQSIMLLGSLEGGKALLAQKYTGVQAAIQNVNNPPPAPSDTQPTVQEGTTPPPGLTGGGIDSTGKPTVGPKTGSTPPP